MQSRNLVIAFAAFLLVSCSGVPKKTKNTGMIAGTVATPKLQPRQSWWSEEADAPGPSKIVINLTEQRAYFYKGKKIVGETNISTGRRGFDTPPGAYKITQKDEKHISN